MKKILILFLILGLTCLPLVGLAQEGELPPNLEKFPVRLMRNGSYQKLKQAIVEEASPGYLIPLREVLELEGYSLDWKEGLITIQKDQALVKLNTKDSKYILKNLDGSIMIELDFFKNFKDLDLKPDLTAKTIIMKSDTIKEGDILDFNLGQRHMITKDGRDYYYNLIGSMTQFQENKPLLIILHGSHHIVGDDRSRYDLGFSYLMKALAADYNCIALNVNPNYSFDGSEPYMNERIQHIFDEIILELNQASQGRERFPLDLRNRVDLNNIYLLGHSRSGQAIFEIYNNYLKKDNIKIKGLISLAPSRMFEMDYSSLDLPVYIVLPELDGDVIGLDGQWIFDELTNFKDRTAPMSLVYLYGANHNATNEAILNQDEGKPWFTGEKFKLGPEVQRDFIKKYVATALDNMRKQDYFNKLRSQDGMILGARALASNYENGPRIYDARNKLDNIKSGTADFEILNQSYIGNLNTAGLFNHPGDREKLELLNIKWNKAPSEIVFDLKGDFKDYSYLNLYMAIDSTDLISNKSDQSLKLVLRDMDNREAEVLLDKDTAALGLVEGEGIFNDTAFSSHTPLSIVSLPLADFDLDLTRLKELALVFSESDSGSLMLRFISIN